MKRFWWLALVIGAVLAGCAPPATKQEDPPSKGQEAVDPDQVLSPTELAAKADIPLYPEADVPNEKSNIKKSESEVRYEIIMTTPDSPAKVMNFYQTKLTQAQTAGKTLMGATKNGNSVMVTATPELGLTTIKVVSIAMRGAK